MKEHIIKAILYQDMTVEWADVKDGATPRLNVHQKTRQVVEVSLGDFVLSDGEAILVAFEKLEDGDFNHVNPEYMRDLRLKIPSIVHNTPGVWGAQFYLAIGYNSATGEYDAIFPYNTVYFLEGSSFLDDGLTIPSAENLNEQYARVVEAANSAANSSNEASFLVGKSIEFLRETKESVLKLQEDISATVQKEVDDLYLLTNATVTGTETVFNTYVSSSTVKNTIEDLIDGSLSRVENFYGNSEIFWWRESNGPVVFEEYKSYFEALISYNPQGEEADSISFKNPIRLGLYDSLDMSTGIIERAGYTQIISPYYEDGSEKTINFIGDAWQVEGWFAASVEDGLNVRAPYDRKIYRGQQRWMLDYISNMMNGLFEWTTTEGNLLPFDDSNKQKYALCGMDNNNFYCIVHNDDLGVSQDDPFEVKAQALRTWLVNNPPVVRYLIDNPSTEMLEDLPYNKYRVYADGRSKIKWAWQEDGYQVAVTVEQTYAVRKGVLENEIYENVNAKMDEINGEEV